MAVLPQKNQLYCCIDTDTDEETFCMGRGAHEQVLVWRELEGPACARDTHVHTVVYVVAGLWPVSASVYESHATQLQALGCARQAARGSWL